MSYMRVLFILVLPVGSAMPAAAQEDPVLVKHRNDCHLATQVLSTGHPAPHYKWALRLIASCSPEQAGSALPHVWENPPADTLSLSQLYFASKRVRDGRIYQEALETVRNPERPELVRLAALGVLAAYVEPDMEVNLRSLEPINSRLIGWQNVWGRVDHYHQEESAVPLPITARDEIIALVRSLAEPKEHTALRDSAWHLLHLLGFGKEEQGLRSAVLVLIALFPASAAGQVHRDSVKHRNDCRLAEQVLRTGHPAPHTTWARQFIGFCGYGVWGKATAAQVRRLRTSRDVEELKAAWSDIAALVDASFFEAALEIAADRSASTPARTFALLHLAMLMDPYIVIRYRELPKDFAEVNAIRKRGGSMRHARYCNAHKILHGGKRPYQG